MSEATNSLTLESGDTEMLLNILWVRLHSIVSNYGSSYAEDVEISAIQRLSAQLGEHFSIVREGDGIERLQPRRKV